MRFSPKRLATSLLFARWKRRCPFEEGYTMLLPSPADMPFLLRFALEGLAHVDTAHCRQIVVIPDGSVEDRGGSLRRVIDDFDDPRVELAPPGPLDYLLYRRMKPVGGSSTHWMMIVNGVDRARCAHVFLHDSDAFFVDPDGPERQYRECLERGSDVLGVTARWDPFFEEVGYAIPGTWELMFSTRWARSHSPYSHKPGWRATPRGAYEFDTMLGPMYFDYPSGRVNLMDQPPRLVHFNGTIVTFRLYHAGYGRIDEYFRILLLAVLEELIPDPSGRRALPPVGDLVRGLTDPSAPVTYGSDVATYQYPIFRAMLEELCDSPVFRGGRGNRVRELVRPFDEHFSGRPAVDPSGLPRVRVHGLG
jgi:hypothetical protein